MNTTFGCRCLKLYHEFEENATRITTPNQNANREMFWIVNAEFAVPIWRSELESRLVGIPEESETTFSDQTGPSKKNGSGLPFFILFRILYISKEKWSNEPVCRNGTANFGRNIPVGRNRKRIFLFY